MEPHTACASVVEILARLIGEVGTRVDDLDDRLGEHTEQGAHLAPERSASASVEAECLLRKARSQLLVELRQIDLDVLHRRILSEKY